ncbi:hypothetical protein FB45DRAFT_1055667 [Roridomyces roridus]|uniref:Uncharacterized protein n=1 Tax=Roridomyces roridus TaxID=1738132 RepID=A0AAD7C7W6_9AGAR|nr:hypothetical protein FB45DRAFT_1055667 [Roridomyces roridus]
MPSLAHHILDLVTAHPRPALASDALDATKVALKAIRDSADVCPPLKSGVSAALVLLEMSERIKQNRQDAATLATRAGQLILDIWGQTTGIGVPLSGGLEGSILQIETLFTRIEAFLHELDEESALRRLIRQDRHKAQLEEYGHLLDLATSKFSINLQLSIHTAQMAQNAADEKRHDDVLRISRISEAERLRLLSVIHSQYQGQSQGNHAGGSG